MQQSETRNTSQYECFPIKMQIVSELNYSARNKKFLSFPFSDWPFWAIHWSAILFLFLCNLAGLTYHSSFNWYLGKFCVWITTTSDYIILNSYDPNKNLPHATWNDRVLLIVITVFCFCQSWRHLFERWNHRTAKWVNILNWKTNLFRLRIFDLFACGIASSEPNQDPFYMLMQSQSFAESKWVYGWFWWQFELIE